MSCRLDEVIGALAQQVITADSGMMEVRDVEHDSRKVTPEALFACIPGAATDGHLHARSAVEAGAVALLVERPLDLGVPEIVVADVRKAIGPASARVHGLPSETMDVVGVTGTNGKTTTVRIVASIVRELGGSAVEIGTLTGSLTTPEAPELQRHLASARDTGHDLAAMEVSSHALDLHRVDGTRFRVAAFTNLGLDHLDHHGDIESYFEAKARLFVPELSDQAVVNVGTPAGRRLAERVTIPCVEVDTTSIAISETSPSRSRFRWRDNEVELPMAGAFNITNAVLAAEIVVALGREPAEVAGAIARVSPVPGRFESIDEGQAFAVIVDYAHTPDGLEIALQAARALTERTLVVVFGAGGDRDQSKRPRMGEVARRIADRVVVTSDNPRNEPNEAIVSAIVSGMDRPPEVIEHDRRVAIRHAIAGVRQGDVVVIAGKGHETTQTIGAHVHSFDDRVVVREELRRLGGVAS